MGARREKKGKKLHRARVRPANWKCCSEVSTGDLPNQLISSVGREAFFFFISHQFSRPALDKNGRNAGKRARRGGVCGGTADDKKGMERGCWWGGEWGPCWSGADFGDAAPTTPPHTSGQWAPTAPCPPPAPWDALTSGPSSPPSQDTEMRGKPQILAVFGRRSGVTPLPRAPVLSWRAQAEKNSW